MKTFIALILITIISGFSIAADAKAGALKKVEPEYVCMINNKLFDKAQIPVTVSGKTYYGCCPMCKEKLEKSAEARSATDPVSGNSIDKATATIGADASGAVFYFESEGNLKRYNN